MTVADQMDRSDFREDLPSHVIDDVRQDKIIMWLDQAEEFFAIRVSSQSRLIGSSAESWADHNRDVINMDPTVYLKLT